MTQKTNFNLYSEYIEQAKQTLKLYLDLREEFKNKPKNARYLRLSASYEAKIQHIKNKLENLGILHNIIEVQFSNNKGEKFLLYYTDVTLELAQILVKMRFGDHVSSETFRVIEPGKIFSIKN